MIGGGLAAIIKRVHNNIVPTRNRVGGGTFVTCAPANAAFKQLAAHATATLTKFGGMIELLAATANTTDAWIEGLMVTESTTAQEANIAITREAGTGAPTAAQIEAQIPVYVDAAAVGGGQFVPVTPSIYIPAGSRIAAALAGTTTKKLSVVACISRRRNST
jgi:hypothetical protein